MLMVLRPYGVFHAGYHHTGLLSPPVQQRQHCGKELRAAISLKIRAMLQSGMKIGKPISQRTGMKLHNLTVKGKQTPAPAQYDMELCYMT